MGDFDELKQWIGATETVTDQVTPMALRALSATLDRDDPQPRPGEAIPPCWHWLYFLTTLRQSDLDADGHGRRGGFLPPVPLPRRMWAGSRLEFLRPLRVGESITRASRIVDVSGKEGRSGPLVFVRVRHEVAAGDGLGPAVIDEQDIVYRGWPKAGDAAMPVEAAPDAHDWARDVAPDAVQLFRYSALTFNSHRIHYDRRYATDVEGYAGLVVHGPLIATLLLDLLRRNVPLGQVSRYSFRAVRPSFEGSTLSLRGRRDRDGNTVHLWAVRNDGTLAMDATALLK